jgi:hypothetical protein
VPNGQILLKKKIEKLEDAEWRDEDCAAVIRRQCSIVIVFGLWRWFPRAECKARMDGQTSGERS